MSALSRGDTPGPEASITKVVSANKLQAVGNFGIDSLDMAGMLKTDDSDVHSFHDAWLGAAGLRIAGGTDEILKTLSPSVFWVYLRIHVLIRAWLLKTYPLENKNRIFTAL